MGARTLSAEPAGSRTAGEPLPAALSAEPGIDPGGRAAQEGDPGLAEQLQAIAAQLWTIVGGPASGLGAGAPALEVGGGAPSVPLGGRAMLALVEQEYQARRRREDLLGEDLFGEPAWDMLLYLFAAWLRGDLVVTSSLVRASAVPATTALRWIALLERHDLVERCTIKRDGRVRVLRLTRHATRRLEHYFTGRLAARYRTPGLPQGDALAGGRTGAGLDGPRRKRRARAGDGAAVSA